MTEPRYVAIYCTRTAVASVEEALWFRRHQQRTRATLGRCYAEKVEGRWRCCCCGTLVSVVW